MLERWEMLISPWAGTERDKSLENIRKPSTRFGNSSMPEKQGLESARHWKEVKA